MFATEYLTACVKVWWPPLLLFYRILDSLCTGVVAAIVAVLAANIKDSRRLRSSRLNQPETSTVERDTVHFHGVSFQSGKLLISTRRHPRTLRVSTPFRRVANSPSSFYFEKMSSLLLYLNVFKGAGPLRRNNKRRN